MRVPVYYYTYHDYLGIDDTENYLWILMPSMSLLPYFDWLRENTEELYLQRRGCAELGRTDLVVLAELTETQATYFGLRWGQAVNQPDGGT